MLLGIGVWPETLYPMVWVAPLVVLVHGLGGSAMAVAVSAAPKSADEAV